ncbi:hypothetical protein PUNSTDRAFT_67333 [Punctularia strigosozonata HHB-11173 SS5]|uniref:uncharacterized protein n=1 Tax=Punctularia strigosozonata (strain HHB-11173) TaxID=741275 RepID=UPI0004416F98|nr:uncharacterized protein PUNSTDRAFT_67333 [Punctularia strigosozonata HHB-11173 SS5]EIN08726.1 hypothetical protein PUNSTDRAFT_67333 [Punctularia strigosozonata HHB-11173 SS5]
MAASHISEEDSQLVLDLYALSNKNRKLVRASEHPAPADPTIKISSWKMNEFKYYDIPSPFPTLARGLFTRQIGDKYKIVARGYDKFFNIGEVPWNTWTALERHTGSPYTLTLKSNGCIIFIAALTADKLLVTSKHSVDSPHAKVGEQWLHKHLASKGKAPEELARTLWEKNWTAVAELCDDSFEEHVLPYGPEVTGLHLHGLNANSRHFKTEQPETVEKFAHEWGFIPTKSTVLRSIPDVKAFTDEIGKTGSWNGEPLEGFVVRTHVTEPPTDGRTTRDRSPYEPGSSFFFKVKFDEPYMMYRDWREVTRAILAGKEPPKSKMKRAETKAYVRWVREEIKRDPAAFKEYQNNKGIVATRQRFLRYLKSEKGEAAVEEVTRMVADAGLNDREEKKEFGKTIIVPVAIPGCGKTCIAVALSHLFGFGHTQSDDVQGKKAGQTFVKNVVNLLRTHDVVIADKNNHLRMHRTALRDATKHMQPPVRLMALNWALDQPPSTIHRICGDRVLARGDNHQSLRGDPLARAHEDVLWQFLERSEELGDDEVDVSIEMSLEDTPEQALRRAVDGCVRVLGVPPPSDDRIAEALTVARGYAPTVKHPDKNKGKKDASTPRYFGLLPEMDVEKVVDDAIVRAEVSAEGRAFWDKLVEQKRVAKRPHVTIVHSKSLPHEKDLWGRCTTLHASTKPPLFSFRLGHLVWDDRVMALTVEDLAVSKDVPDPYEEGVAFLVKLPKEVAGRLHITVGTRDKDVNPVEAKDLVQRWRNGDSDVNAVPLDKVFVKGRLKGLF